MTSPDPVPEPPGPAAAMVTTEGSTWSATEVTWQLMAVLAEAPALELVVLLLPDDVQPASAAPAATGNSSHGSHRRRAAPRSVTRSPSAPSRSSPRSHPPSNRRTP